MEKNLWISWKDTYSKNCGGAENVTHNLLNKISLNNNKFILITPKQKGLKKIQRQKNYIILRPTNILFLPFYLFFFSRNKKVQLSIEEINTFHFFTKFFLKSNKKKIFIHQLTEIVWFYEINIFISLIGYIYEKISLKFLKNIEIVTISNSTKNNLINNGLKAEKIKIIPQIINFINIKYQKKKFNKQNIKLFYFGSLRKMKNVEFLINTFIDLSIKNSNYEFNIISNDADKAKKLKKKYSNIKKINFLNSKELKDLNYTLNEQDIFLFSSRKEGWGLVISELNSLGKPCIAVNVDGVRDSIINNHNGILIKNFDKIEFQKKIIYLSDFDIYEKFSFNCLQNTAELKSKIQKFDYKSVF